MKAVVSSLLLMGVLAGCGSGATGVPAASDGLDCDSDLREGWHLDYASEAVPTFASPDEAVRAAVDVGGADLVVGGEQDRGDVVSVYVRVERGGRTDKRVEVREYGDDWVADNVTACG